jgi:hypothetical protein
MGGRSGICNLFVPPLTLSKPYLSTPRMVAWLPLWFMPLSLSHISISHLIVACHYCHLTHLWLYINSWILQASIVSEREIVSIFHIIDFGV